MFLNNGFMVACHFSWLLDPYVECGSSIPSASFEGRQQLAGLGQGQPENGQPGHGTRTCPDTARNNKHTHGHTHI